MVSTSLTLPGVNALKLDTLQCLAQRWFLPKRKFGYALPYLLKSNSFWFWSV